MEQAVSLQISSINKLRLQKIHKIDYEPYRISKITQKERFLIVSKPSLTYFSILFP
jgi:hypothetical protein